ncbi:MULTISPECIES: hypothetical protein [Pectobacterium]|uniref:Transposase n=1 Tax=Pectobacterium aroidearum TaxID=1201031 RepID=A0AAW3SXZ4_9GAMM|nr:MULTISPECIES: hypothetical protein [Pectobacterium]MBA0205644.1 hypothetical protein [Pectobacterium aroidearum]MBA5205698.1 hypothetical protein [Pectobacterium aroidearum]MBA5602330.1 hypothetical protein [Pectobacterium aroidearum]QPI43883.1 hypothetical protein I2D83_04490 [Pectobacterium aroidearum]UUE37181.1 hypothetical protein L0Y26_04325 [Pectobacterium aroidearum]
MGLQLIVKAKRNKIEKALGLLTSECEIFPVAEDLFGISIPERSLSSVGEDVVLHKLKQLKRFDLWQGSWQESKRYWFR